MKQPGKVIIVTGGRTFNDREMVDRTLTEVDPGAIYQGGCPGGKDKDGYWQPGADLLARWWGEAKGRAVFQCDANWDYFTGYSGGPIRNEWMAMYAHAHALVAFPGGKGTASMRRIAQEYGIPIIEVQ